MSELITVGIDVRDLRIAKTGTLTYLRELCDEFKKTPDADIRFHFLDTSLRIYSGNNKLLKWAEHINYQLWKQIILPVKAWRKGCDIVFCTDNLVPFVHLGFKTIPVFHDAFFFEMPENYSRVWLWLFKNTVLPGARRSPFIVTPTHYAKQQLQRFTGITANKFVVVYEGPRVLTTASEKDSSDFLLTNGLQKKQYLLHVGSFFKRKNIPLLIQAFNLLKATGNYPSLKLVLAGPPPPDNTESGYAMVIAAINQTKFAKDIVLTGFISDYDLATLYKNALLYVFPSINEGFGIPVLEAFSHKLPVLVANNTCLPEVGADAVVTFDPFSVDDITVKMQKVLDDDQLRQLLIDKGQERLGYFSWQKATSELIAVFKDAASSS